MFSHVPNGRRDVLLGFATSGEEDGAEEPSTGWFWCDLQGESQSADIAELPFPSSAWQEVLLSKGGDIEVVLLSDGQIYRLLEGTWQCIGQLQTRDASSPVVLPPERIRQHLISIGPDGNLLVVDKLAEGMPANEAFAAEAKQAASRGLMGLVSISAEGAKSVAFAHPHVDVTADAIWLDPADGRVDAVAVEDVWPEVFQISDAAQDTVRSDLQSLLPKFIEMSGVTVASELEPVSGAQSQPPSRMQPVWIQRYGDRLAAAYWHPQLPAEVALTATLKEDGVESIGSTALPLLGTDARADALRGHPQVEGHRIALDGGESGVVAYVLRSQKRTPSAFVVRAYVEPERARWGADAIDAWLLQRGYGLVKINLARGGEDASSGSAGALRARRAGQTNDVVRALQWLQKEGRVGAKDLPVAIMGKNEAGSLALHAASLRPDIFGSVVAIAPTADVTSDPDRYFPLSDMVHQDRVRRVLLIEFELSNPEAAGTVPPSVVALQDSVDFVQYGGEDGQQIGISSNYIDMYRRIEHFLHSSMSSSRGAQSQNIRFAKEAWVHELPWLSAALVPSSRGAPCEHLQQLQSEVQPTMRIASALMPQDLKVRVQTCPKHSIRVDQDGTMSLLLEFEKEVPRDLFMTLTRSVMHGCARGVRFAIHLPRPLLADAKHQLVKMLKEPSLLVILQGDADAGVLQLAAAEAQDESSRSEVVAHIDSKEVRKAALDTNPWKLDTDVAPDDLSRRRAVVAEVEAMA